MSYNEYLRDKKRAMPHIVSPTRINTSGLFTQMRRYKAAVPQNTVESAGTMIQHKSAAGPLAKIGNAAVCCAPTQETVTIPAPGTGTSSYSGWPALIVSEDIGNLSNSVTYYGGNVYVAGAFSGNTDFYDGGITDPSLAPPAVQILSGFGFSGFIASYTAESGKVNWVAPIDAGGEFSGVQLYSITVDATGVYVTGIFSLGTIDFYNGVGSGSLTLTSGVASLETTNPYALLIAKYSLSGDVLWINMVDNVSLSGFPLSSLPVPYPLMNSICKNGNSLYICNYFQGSAVIYNADGLNQPSEVQVALAEISSGGPNAFLVQYDLSGAVQWATKFDNTESISFGVGIACDISNVYMSGYFNTTTDYYNTVTQTSETFDICGTLVTQIPGDGDSMFIISYTSIGAFAWANQCDSTISFPTYGVRLTVDSTGVTALVVFGDGLTIYNNAGSYGSSANLTNDISENINFGIIKYNKQNGDVTWINKINNISINNDNNFSFSYFGIYSDGASIYVTGGQYDSNIDLYNAGTIDPTSSVATLDAISTSGNLFLLKYNASGALQWMTLADNPDEFDTGTNLIIDNGRIFVTGFGSGNIDFYNAAGLTQPSIIGTSMNSENSYSFVVEYDTNGQIVTQATPSGTSCCYLKLRPYPWNGYKAKRPDPPAINYPPLGGGECNCP